MTSTNEQIRLWLIALVIGSVLTMTIVFSGIAAAIDINRGTTDRANDWSTTDGSGNVGDGAVIYRGEDDITLVDEDGSTPAPVSFEATSGPATGAILQMPVPLDQPTGTYESQTDDFTLTVREPRVTTLEILNDDGNDVTGGTLPADQTQAAVYVEYNYDTAEDIEVTVENEAGVDITDEIVDSSATRNGDGEIGIDPGNVDAGEYTFTVEGVNDLDHGEASKSVAVEITAPERVPPTAAFEYEPDVPAVDDSVTFDASESFDPDGEIVRYSWDFEKADSIDNQSSSRSTAYAYDESGVYTAVLEVVDDDGAVGRTETTIRVVGPTTTIPTPTTAPTATSDRTPIPDRTPTPTGTPTPNGTSPVQIGGFGMVGLTIGLLLGFFGNQEVRLSVIAIFGGIFSGQFLNVIPEDVNPGLILGVISAGVAVGVVLGTILRQILPEDSN